MQRLVLTTTLTLMLGCGGPLVMLPGGALSGPVETPPADWSFTDAHETVQLETRPADPYSVNVWGTAAGDHFYVAGRADNEWAAHIAADPNVRVRIDGTVYELHAEATSDEAELDAFLVALEKKYDFEPDPEERERAALFRLTPRPAR